MLRPVFRALACIAPLAAAIIAPARAETIYTPYTFTTFAGSAGTGSADGRGLAAGFSSPFGIGLDPSGTLYVCDSQNFTIRKVTSDGTVTTLAGSPGQSGTADGVGSAARFTSPTYVAVDRSGVIYVSDTDSHVIRKILPTGLVMTLAGSPGASGSFDGVGAAARFNQPRGLAVDPAGALWVCDTGNRCLRKITADGRVTTVASLISPSGATTPIALVHPTGLAIGADGALYIADNGDLKKITLNGTMTAQYFPSGPVRASRENAVAVDSRGTVYLTDDWFIRTILPGEGPIYLALRNDPVFFQNPRGLAVDANGTVFIADTGNNSIQRIATGVVSTLAGFGPTEAGGNQGRALRLSQPWGLTRDQQGNVYVSEQGFLSVRKLSSAAVTLGGVGTQHESGSSDTFDDPARSSVKFGADGPYGLAVDPFGNLIVADASNSTLRKVAPNGITSTIAGLVGQPGSVDGDRSRARLGRPTFITYYAAYCYISDYTNRTIRRLAPDGSVITVAGIAGVSGSADGRAGFATFQGPSGIATDTRGNIYVADVLAHTIRRISEAGEVTTVAGLANTPGSDDGPAASARFWSPGGLAFDGSGNLYIADTGNSTIRRLDTSGRVTTLAGVPRTPDTSSRGYADGTGSAARFSTPMGIAVDFDGNVFVADPANNQIRLGSAAPPAPFNAPTAERIHFGTTAHLDGAARGALSYQWYLNDVPLEGATKAAYDATHGGNYRVETTNGAGTTRAGPYTVALTNRLSNLSFRTVVGTGENTPILGFAVDSPGGFTKRLLIRALGPALVPLGVPDAVAATTLTLYDGRGLPIVSNSGWNSPLIRGPFPFPASPTAATASAMATVQAFPLAAGSGDSAFFVDLPPGLYTASAFSSRPGTTMIEIYEANASEVPVLSNLSARALIGSTASPIIAGFAVRGEQPASLLIRGVGPTLASFGLRTPLARPLASLYTESSALIASSNNWLRAPTPGAVPAAATATATSITAMQRIGAFPLTAATPDAAFQILLPAGNYSTILSGEGGSSGTGLIELYLAP